MLWLLGLASSVSHGGSRSLDFLCFVCSGDKIFLGCVSSGPYPYSGKSEHLDFCNFVCYHSPAWYWIVRGGAHQVTFGKYILQIRFTICLAKFSRQPDCVINLFQSSVKKDGIFQSVIFFAKLPFRLVPILIEWKIIDKMMCPSLVAEEIRTFGFLQFCSLANYLQLLQGHQNGVLHLVTLVLNACSNIHVQFNKIS